MRSDDDLEPQPPDAQDTAESQAESPAGSPAESKGKEQAAGTGEEEAALPRKVLAELVGTFFLTLVGAGIEVVAALHPGDIDRTVKAAAPGLVVAAMIYALGDVSGAHLNPVVTLAFGLRRSFTAWLVPIYWATQVAGAILAACTLRGLFGTARDVGINRLDGATAGKGVVIEAMFTMLLVMVILNTAHKHSLIGTQAAIAVGGTITVCGFVGGELTTMSMNPARSIGPAIVAGTGKDLWVYLVGPAVGALAAVVIVSVLRPHPNPDEREAAQGKDARATRDAPSRQAA